MSHKTTVELKLNNETYLLRALDKLGFKYSKGANLKTHSRWGVSEPVDILLEGSAANCVGFRKKENGNYEAVGDFYDAKSPTGNKLSEKVLQQEVTAVSKEAEILDRLGEMGFSEELGSRSMANGKIKLTLERWVD